MDKIEKIDKSLEEAAETHVKNKYCLTKLLGAEIREAVNDFIAGAEWQREDMMKDAVEGHIVSRNDGWNSIELPSTFFGELSQNYNHGDKVRIVVLKEPEE